MASQTRFRTLEDDRVSAEEMDEIRQENIAYQYLCHLEEARVWIQACIKEDLPPPTELEESLRNGVYLAKLAHFFAPETVPVKKIYDFDQKCYQDRGLDFRHTDNINHWLNAMKTINMPVFFYPDTFDVYDKKNMPKVIYCLHALSLYLFKLGKAPQIQDLYGKLQFTFEEIDAIRKELEKYGIQMPAFGKIGGILANELPVDAAALHAAVIAINNAIDLGNSAKTLETMENPVVSFCGIISEMSERYQTTLYEVKKLKMEEAHNRSLDLDYIPDVYDEYLTKDEIQNCVSDVNKLVSLELVDDALIKGDEKALLKALTNSYLELSLKDFSQLNISWYLKALTEEKNRHESNNNNYILSQNDIQNAMEIANMEASNQLKLDEAVKEINSVIKLKDPLMTVSALKNPNAKLGPIIEEAATLYQEEFLTILQENGKDLVYEEIKGGVKILSTIGMINLALKKGDPDELYSMLEKQNAYISSLDARHSKCYYKSLVRAKEEKFKIYQNNFLTHLEIQECIDEVNTQMELELAQVECIRTINHSVQTKNEKATLESILNPAASILCVEPTLATLYLQLLFMSQQEKIATNQKSFELGLDEIQHKVNEANQLAADASLSCVAIAAVNLAVENENLDELQDALQNQYIGIPSVFSQYVKEYLKKFQALKRKKETSVKKSNNDACDEDNAWLEYQVRSGNFYYFNMKTFESSWKKPKSYKPLCSYLTKSDIVKVVSVINSEYDHQTLFTSMKPLITHLQAHIRGFLVRQQLQRKMEYYHANENKIVQIQRWWRQCLKRRIILMHAQEVKRILPALVKIQAWVRMWLAQRRYLKTREHFKNHEDSVRKIQTFWRANRTKRDFKELIHSPNPPLYIIKKFVHMLNVNESDYAEEVEFQEIRGQVVQTIRRNNELENEVNEMDLKIGLLVRNRITLQEVISQGKKLKQWKKGNGSQGWEGPWIDTGKGLKALSKESRSRLVAYQHLFYALQTEPNYLAKLIFAMSPSRTTKFVESVILTLYNFGSTPREDYLLLHLFRTALEEEVHSKVDSPMDIVTGNPLVIRMVVGFNRNGRGQSCLRELLEPLIKEVINDKTLHINTNPIEVYKMWINEHETQTGQQSTLPYDVSQEEALSHEEVQKRFDKAIKSLQEKALIFCNTIVQSLDKIPYGMLYIAKVLYNCLIEKFPDTAEKDILKVVGNLLYYRYINSAIVAPDAFDIIDIGPDESLTNEQRRNLGSIAKVLQFASLGKGFGHDTAHLMCLNPFLKRCHENFKNFFRQACTVEEPEEFFNMDWYSEATMLTQPTIYLSVQELCDTHQLLVEFEEQIAPNAADMLHELLEDVGKPPTIQTLVGENIEPTAVAHVAQTEICLTLSSKFQILREDTIDTDQLFIKTKQMMVDLLQHQFQHSSLTEILHCPISQNDEIQFTKRQHQVSELNVSVNLNKSTSSGYKRCSSFEDFRNSLVKNLYRLELAGYVSSKNDYQDILNSIAKDIYSSRQYRQHRKQEVLRLRNIQKQLDLKTSYYEEKLDYYHQYVKTCLSNLTSGHKKLHQRRAVPGSGSKQKNEEKELRNKTSLKYNGAKLHEKGILVEITDLDPVQLKNVSFEIAPARDTGVFTVSARFMGVQMEKVDVDIQDLLHYQYQGIAIMEMFERARVNVNLLLYLLNSKFYGKKK